MKLVTKEISVKCSSCKTIHTFLTTAENIHIEICSGCHPFFTGKEILVDSDNRLQRFNARNETLNNSNQRMSKRDRLIAKKKLSKSSDEKPKLTLKDMLASIK